MTTVAGILPLAMTSPDELRAAATNGTAQVFS